MVPGTQTLLVTLLRVALSRLAASTSQAVEEGEVSGWCHFPLV